MYASATVLGTCLAHAASAARTPLPVQGNTDFDDKCDTVIKVPETVEFLAPIVTVVPLQLLSYHIADMRGCNVDQPRNLAKSVTVE